MQESIFESKEFNTCVFTGHREMEENFNVKELKKSIEYYLSKGVKTFYNGGAVGFDLLSAETVLKLKKKHDIKLVVCVPFYGQETRYSKADKARYAKILKNADEVVILADSYYKGCLLRRNDYMIERADCMIAYLKKEEGGTAYTVKKFRVKKSEEILFV